MARNLGTSVRNSAIVKVAPVFFEPSAIRTPSKTKTMLNQPHLQNTLGQTRTERRIISFKTQREGLQNKVVGKKIADVGFVPIPVPTAASSFKPSVSKPPLAKNKEQVLVSSAIQTSSYGQKVAKAQAQASTKVRAGNQALQANANAKQATLNSNLEVQTNPYKEWFKNASHQFMPHCDSENKGFVKGHGHPCPPSDMVLSSKSKSVANMKKNQNQVKPEDDRCPLAPRKGKARSRLEDFLHSTKSFQEKTHSVKHDHQVMENESWIEFSTPEKQMGSYHHKSCPQAPAKGELLSHFDGLTLSPYKEWFINASYQGMPHRDFENKGFVKDHGCPYPPDMVLSSKLKSVAEMKKNQNQVKPKDDQCPLAPRKCKARSCLEDFLHSTKSFQEKTHSVRHDHQVMENESWIEFSTPKKQMGSYHHKSCP